MSADLRRMKSFSLISSAISWVSNTSRLPRSLKRSSADSPPQTPWFSCFMAYSRQAAIIGHSAQMSLARAMSSGNSLKKKSRSSTTRQASLPFHFGVFTKSVSASSLFLLANLMISGRLVMFLVLSTTVGE